MTPNDPIAIRPAIARRPQDAMSYAGSTHAITAPALRRAAPPMWMPAFLGASLIFMLLMLAIAWLLIRGVGIWGINVPVAWGFAIVNFVWWIGIGHAGTLISAILLLLRQEWRTSINRFAEAMTLFAVACAGLFPLLHLGRIWKFYYLLPYPNSLALWPQWRSPLVWDVFAVTTYGTVSLIFWYVGLIPDLATLRDRARSAWAQRVYAIFALGWRGSAKHWQRYQMAYLLLAGLATPLVVSVHSIVSFDFAVSLVPGWHVTIFPPYFVAGAIYSGFAMVLTLMIPLRRWFGFKEYVTAWHLDVMAKVMLATGLIVLYGYIAEGFMAWYSGVLAERFVALNRLFGPYAPLYWSLIISNAVVPQVLWMKWFRSNSIALWIVAIVVNIGMWLERFVIVITSLHRDYMPSAWRMYYPTIWDWATYIGTIGLFVAALLLFLRVLPSISLFEIRELSWHRRKHEASRHSHGSTTATHPGDL